MSWLPVPLPTGFSLTAGTSFLDVKSYTKLNPTLDPISNPQWSRMGRAFSVLLLCVAMDPWYHYVHRIPRVLTNRGYMDDNATGGLGLQWLPEAQKLINRFSTAGLVVLTHSCYKIELLSSTPFTLPHYEILSHVTSGLPSLFQAYSSLPLTGIIRLRSGNHAVTLHSSSLRFGNTLTCPSHPDVLTFLHTTVNVKPS